MRGAVAGAQVRRARSRGGGAEGEVEFWASGLSSSGREGGSRPCSWQGSQLPSREVGPSPSSEQTWRVLDGPDPGWERGGLASGLSRRVPVPGMAAAGSPGKAVVGSNLSSAQGCKEAEVTHAYCCLPWKPCGHTESLERPRLPRCHPGRSPLAGSGLVLCSQA